MKKSISNSVVCSGVFCGGEIEPGTFHGGEIEPGAFHTSVELGRIERLMKEAKARSKEKANSIYQMITDSNNSDASCEAND